MFIVEFRYTDQFLNDFTQSFDGLMNFSHNLAASSGLIRHFIRLAVYFDIVELRNTDQFLNYFPNIF